MIPSRIATLTSHRTRIAFIGASKAFQTCGPMSARSLTTLAAKHRALDRAKRDNLCSTPNIISGYQTRAMNVAIGQQGTSIQATALVYSGYGRPVDVLKILEHILPPPADDSVQVQFLAAPINPADINQVEGVYPLKPAMTTQLYSRSSSSSEALPVAVGGNEGVAKVINVGAKVSQDQLKVGDWVVMGSAGLGTWRTHGNFKATDLTRISGKAGRTGKDEAPRLDRLQLATLTVNPCTAYRMLRDFKTLSAGDYIIQNGANSGVGEAVVQMARALGVKTINIIRNREGHEQVAARLRALGATHILTDDQLGKIETKDLVKSWLAQAQGKKEIKLGFNCVGGKATTEMARMLSKNGHLVTYGAMSRQPLILPASLQIFKNVHASGFWLSAWNDEHSTQERQEMIDAVLDIMDEPGHPFSEINCTSNTWSLTRTGDLQTRLLEVVQKATTAGNGKQVFVME
ncbi:mitochondrial 2-enoyl thioester reductase [Podila minutissima]|nr:mitochondrial 2-enoyl thioester reductase [Podila minutissima]